MIGIVEAKGHQKEVVDLIAATLRENAATRPSAAKFVSHLRCLLGEDVLTPPEPELYPSPMKMSKFLTLLVCNGSLNRKTEMRIPN